MSEEEWRGVVGYEGIYQVSNLGRVRRVAGGQGAVPGRILKPQVGSNHYLSVHLFLDGEETQVLIHRLVAEAFLPCLTQDLEANHKNGDKQDSKLSNLEWVTASRNMRHALRILGAKHGSAPGEKNGSAKLTRREVKRIRQLYSGGGYTQYELGEMFGVSRSTIGEIVRGDGWQHIDGPRSRDNVPLGEENPQSRLRRCDVKRIRRLHSTGDHTQKELVDRFGISQSNVGKIVRRETWEHVSWRFAFASPLG